MPTQKTQREERERDKECVGERDPWPFDSSFYVLFFFLPLGLLYVN